MDFDLGTVLAVDLGLKTGYAMRVHGEINSGVLDFRNSKFENWGMKYLRFENWLNELSLRNEKIVVFFEEVRRHLGVDASHAYGAFMGLLITWCEKNNYPYQGIPVGTIKKHITGKGNASKELVIVAVKGLGHNPKDDNEADAIALMDYVIKNKLPVV